MTGVRLPVADTGQVRAYIADLVRRHPRQIWTTLALHATAAVAGLVAPRLVGQIVEDVRSGTTVAHVDTLALIVAVSVVVQTLITRTARYRSFVLGEQILAELREDFVENTLA